MHIYNEREANVWGFCQGFIATIQHNWLENSPLVITKVATAVLLLDTTQQLYVLAYICLVFFRRMTMRLGVRTGCRRCQLTMMVALQDPCWCGVLFRRSTLAQGLSGVLQWGLCGLRTHRLFFFFFFSVNVNSVIEALSSFYL